MKKIVFCLAAVFFLLNVAWAECVPGDVTAPTRITDLKALVIADDGIIICFTTPNDESSMVAYDVRCRTTSLTALNFASSTQFSGEPLPGVAGNVQTIVLEGLTPNTTYYIGMKTQDQCGRWSTLSNVITVKTLSDWNKLGLVISWNKSQDSNLNLYRVYYGLKSRFGSNFVCYDFCAETSASDCVVTLILNKGYSYYLAVTAINNSGLESVYSTEVGTDGLGVWYDDD